MPAKEKKLSVYLCQNCGHEQKKWSGQCGECHQWNTLEEQQISKSSGSGRGSASVQRASTRQHIQQSVKSLTQYSQEDQLQKNFRLKSGIDELDRVVGGGFFPGSVLLLGGEPGIGKSTLLMQAMGAFAPRMKVLYVSGEESGSQVAQRAQRLNALHNDLQFLATSHLSELIGAMEMLKPKVIVIDSIQTIASENLESAPGTLSQIRDVTHDVIQRAKADGSVAILVGHVTKEGQIAGPRLLEHMVDAVFYFENANNSPYRMLRAQKNRFGPTNELAVFEMGSKGLEEVLNPSERFLEERASEMPGSAIVAQLEGTRPFLNEVQALVQNSYQGFPRRTNQGVDQNRISVLLAVLEKSLGARFSEQDVYCKVSCGAKIHESAADCALCMALLSALREEALPKDAIFIGEVGLGGEIRSVSGLSIRVEEALRTGFRRAFVPAHSAKEVKNLKGVSVVPVRNIQELQDTAFE